MTWCSLGGGDLNGGRAKLWSQILVKILDSQDPSDSTTSEVGRSEVEQVLGGRPARSDSLTFESTPTRDRYYSVA